MGDLCVDEGVASNCVGLRRRSKLAVMCLEHVLPFWNKAFPGNDFPERVLAMIKDYRTGILTYQSLDDILYSSWVDIDDLGNEFPNEIAGNIGYAAIKAARVAMSDEDFDPSNIDLNEKDEMFDIDEKDTSWWAASVYAGDGYKSDDATVRRRREFWEWYIEHAARESWKAA